MGLKMLNLLLILIGFMIFVIGIMTAIPSARDKIIARFSPLGVVTRKFWGPYLVMFVGIAIMSGNFSTLQANNAGFPDTQTFQAARSAGLTSYADYQKYVEEKQAQTKLAEIEAEKNKAEEDAKREKEKEAQMSTKAEGVSTSGPSSENNTRNYDWDLVVEGCKTWARARQECAAAGNFDNCMQVKNTGGGSGNICNENGTPF